MGTGKNTEKKRIVVLGAGIMGVTQAHYLKKLCKDNVDVIIIDKGMDVCVEGASFCNGALHHAACQSWASIRLFIKLLQSFVGMEENVGYNIFGFTYKNI